jgi:hypothetical protein
MNPTKNRGWTQVLQKGKQFLLLKIDWIETGYE